ncbi:MAG: 4Fe-4S binding protein [Desulfobacterales bacterium]|nr:4Fe-4S binding protein [Desulfobacterales bacterium]
MISLNVKKGYRLKITGEPPKELVELPKPSHVALLPEKIPFIKPRLKVRVGDHVETGSEIFEDKRNTRLKFLSPGSGQITEINFGPRRVIKEVVIKLDNKESYVPFEHINKDGLQNIDRNDLVKMLSKGGLWPLLRALPYQDIAPTDKVPPQIIVSLGSSEPFQVSPEIYLDGNTDLFAFGISVLEKLSNNNVIIAANAEDKSRLPDQSGRITHIIKGDYPADNPGVILYKTKTSAAQNNSWFINTQDVLLIAGLLKEGAYPTGRIVAVGGELAPHPGYVKTRIGAPVSHITQNENNKIKSRCVAGGIMTGYSIDKKSFLGFYETSVLILPEGGKRELFGFIQPGFNKQSYSRTFLSSINRSHLNMNCNMNGEERACVACGSCAEVCPVDIIPSLTFKCTLADEIEESLSHGLLDCVECGLCTYVCPSKIEICTILQNAKRSYYKEMSG